MHERSLVAALLRQVDQVVAGHGKARAVVIRVSVGEFCGVDAELFQLAFEDASSGSAIEGARLEIEIIGLEAQCDDCGRTFLVERFRFECPCCGSARASIARGEDLMLESVTMEGN